MGKKSSGGEGGATKSRRRRQRPRLRNCDGREQRSRGERRRSGGGVVAARGSVEAEREERRPREKSCCGTSLAELAGSRLTEPRVREWGNAVEEAGGGGAGGAKRGSRWGEPLKRGRGYLAVDGWNMADGGASEAGRRGRAPGACSRSWRPRVSSTYAGTAGRW